MFKVKHTYRVRGDNDIIETTEVIIEREEPHARISETFSGDLVGRDDLVELVLNQFIERERGCLSVRNIKTREFDER